VRRDVQITFHIPCACEHHIVIHSRGAELMAVRDIMQWRAYTSCPFVPCLASAYNFMFSCTSARQVAEQRKLSCSPVLSNCIAFDHRSCMPTVHGHVLGLQLCLSQVSSAASTCHCMPSAHVYPLFMAMCLASSSVCRRFQVLRRRATVCLLLMYTHCSWPCAWPLCLSQGSTVSSATSM
jgi:hypothetical protein